MQMPSRERPIFHPTPTARPSRSTRSATRILLSTKKRERRLARVLEGLNAKSLAGLFIRQVRPQEKCKPIHKDSQNQERGKRCCR